MFTFPRFSTVLVMFLMVIVSPQVMSQTDIRKQLQTQFIMAEDGDTVHIDAGNFKSSGTISMDGKKRIVIMGKGMDKTNLSFKGQTEGAEGFLITHSSDITFIGLTVEDAKGDGIKVKDTDGIAFRDVRVSWTGKPSKKSGAYGFYSVSCTNVLIEKCEAIGASDAGIYVGQSHNIIVRNSIAYHNVAGIEIENSTVADVYQCEAYENTAGVLVFDLPDLPKKKGGNVRVYENYIHDNNYKNFAPKGNIVGFVPSGTGVLVLATNDVEIFDNRIEDNRTSPTSVVSYYMTERPINDKDYYPYPTGIYIHDNTYKKERRAPTHKHKLGWLLTMKFKKDIPDIVYDGIIDPKTLDSDGNVLPEYQICIRNNGDATFANLDAENKFKNINQDISVHDCEREGLKVPKLTVKN